MHPSFNTAKLSDHGRALINPGMGWVFHHYDNSIEKYGSRLDATDTLEDFPGAAVVYLRLAWSQLEPREGEFAWSMVDSVAQRWINCGKRVCFRFTASESNPPDGTPRWVHDAGAKGYVYKAGEGVLRKTGPGDKIASNEPWEPDFDDPVFLDKLGNFLAAAAARYDGDPTVDWIDIGSFGIWGEGHTFWSTKRTYSAQTLIRHIDLHCRHFKRTLLVANDDFADHGRGPDSLAYAASIGLALRDDSILVFPTPEAYHGNKYAPPFWGRAPIIIESDHWGSSAERGAWGDGEEYLNAIEDYRGSYASIHWWPREFRDAHRDLIDRINLRLGYRLRLIEARWSSLVQAGDEIQIAATWANAGVAPCFPGGHPAYTLIDANGGIVATWVDDQLNVRDLPTGKADELPRLAKYSDRRWIVPHNVRPGRYRLLVSVGNPMATPTIALPYDHDDGRRRYQVGEVEVAEPG